MGRPFFDVSEVSAVEYPVCMDDRRVGTLYVNAAGGDTELRALCRGAEKGLYRLYLRGSGGEVPLGVTEDGCLHRVFSPALLAPAGDFRCAVLRRCGGGEAPRPGFLACLPPEARVARRGGRAEVTIPWREGEAFPLEQLFCFARPGRDGIVYLFDGAGQPVMPEF